MWCKLLMQIRIAGARRCVLPKKREKMMTLFRKITLAVAGGLAAVAVGVPGERAVAQNVLSAKEMVALTPMLPERVTLSREAKEVLAQKLGQIVTQNGFGSVSGQMVLTAHAVTVDKSATGSVPVQFAVKMEVTFYALDLIEGTVIDSYTVSVQGVDPAEHKAVIKALAQIRPKSPALRGFMGQVRERIIDYYTTRIPALITKARTLEKMGRRGEALALLGSVPEQVDEYPVVAQEMQQIAERGGMSGQELSERDALVTQAVRKILADALNRWYVDKFLAVE